MRLCVSCGLGLKFGDDKLLLFDFTFLLPDFESSASDMAACQFLPPRRRDLLPRPALRPLHRAECILPCLDGDLAQLVNGVKNLSACSALHFFQVYGRADVYGHALVATAV